MEKFGQSLALSKNLLIAVRRLSGDGLALSVSLRSPALPLGELVPKVTERVRMLEGRLLLFRAGHGILEKKNPPTRREKGETET